jgi:hypothetical protein
MLDRLLLGLVEWIAKEPRLYAEVMEAWRTSCPRLPVWETAMDRRYLRASESTRVSIASSSPRLVSPSCVRTAASTPS